MPTAIVTGATGINGRAIIDALSQDPQTWTKVYSMSRRQKPSPSHQTSNITHSTLDLLSSASEMARQLQGIEAEYVFFCAYIAKDSEQGNVEANVPMLANLLQALAKTGAEKKLKRVILTAGLKQYGVQLGRPKNPMEETDPPLRAPDRPPNFYYHQQDVLKEMSKGQDWDYVVTYPQDVIGVAHGNSMNLATSLGLYAAVAKEAFPDSELPFPGSRECFLGYNCWTSSKLHARFCLWAALAVGVGGEGFNVVNGDTESWQNMWPKLVERFGGKIPQNHFTGQYHGFEGSKFQLALRPPIEDFFSEVVGMKGEFPPNHLKPRIDPQKWAKRPDVIKAYEELQRKYNLDKGSWEKATWDFMAFTLGRDNDCIVSMSKARKFGFTGYQDTWESFVDAFDELEKEGVLPPTK